MKNILLWTWLVLIMLLNVGATAQSNNTAFVQSVTSGSSLRASEVNYPSMVIGPQKHWQMGNLDGGYTTAGTYYTSSVNERFNTEIVDDIFIPEGENWDIRYLRTTLYNSSSLDSVKHFRVSIYEDNNGVPQTTPKYLFTDVNKITISSYLSSVYIIDVTMEFPETVSLSGGKRYWIGSQAVSNTSGVTGSDLPDWRIGPIFQAPGDPVNKSAMVYSPGTGYFYIPVWTTLGEAMSTIGGSDALSNMNFAVFAPAKQHDLFLTQISSPVSAAEMAYHNVVIRVQNHGTDLVNGTDYTVRYSLDGGSSWASSQQGVTIKSGEEAYITFNDKVDLSTKGVYSIKVEVNYAADEFKDNNIKDIVVENYGKLYPAVANKHVTYIVTGCSGTFTDHGGVDPLMVESYDTVTFYPSTKGKRIRLEFYDTDMKYNDVFVFYNGSSTKAPMIGTYYTRDVNGFTVEGANSEGSITVIMPSIDVQTLSEPFDFFANISCRDVLNKEFEVRNVTVSNPYNWAFETVEVNADLLNKGAVDKNTMVTFFANDQELTTVSSTLSAYGEISTASFNWTPQSSGTYTIKAQLEADDANFPAEKEMAISQKVFEYGQLVEGFELESYPPQNWENRIPGGSRRNLLRSSEWDYYEGKWNVLSTGDTLITPLLDIKANDSLSFIGSHGYFGGSCKIMYSASKSGPWTSLPGDLASGIKTYKYSLGSIAGEKYLAFKMTGQVNIDYVRGPKMKLWDYDLSAVSLEKTSEKFVVGENYSFSLMVRNLGLNNIVAADYTVKLWGEAYGVKIQLAQASGKDISKANYTTFTFEASFAESKEMDVYATIEYNADNYTANNKSNSHHLYILEPNTEFFFQGNENTTDKDEFTLGINKMYSEVIYLKDSLNFAGEIKGITIYYKNTIKEKTTPFTLYMSETDKSNLDKAYLSRKKMDLVYSGSFVQKTTGDKYVPYYIEFDQPFLYSGQKNLALSFLNTTGSSSSLLGTLVNRVAQRIVILQNANLSINFADSVAVNTLVASAKKQIPNMLFVVKNKGMEASVVGKATSQDGTGIADVKFNIEGFANTVYSGSSGDYAYPVLPDGSFTITAEKYGYITQQQIATTTQNVPTELNFVMNSLPPVTVSGVVVNDDKGLPVEGVTISMIGYGQVFNVKTDSEGKFAINNVLGNHDYELTLSHQKYDSLVKIVKVVFDNVDLGTIAVNEKETPAFNLLAVANAESKVALTWNAPYSGKDTLNDPTHGSYLKYYWYNEPDENIQMGNLFHYNDTVGTVTSVQISNFGWTLLSGAPGSQEAELSLRFYNQDRVEFLPPVYFTMPDSSMSWFTVDVPDFTYNNDFYVMVHWDKIHEQTSALYTTENEDNVAWTIDGNGKWTLLTSLVGSKYSGAFSIRANILFNSNNPSRELLSYDVWRTSLVDVANSSRWDKINSQPIVNTVTVTDTTYSGLAAGYYIYALKANYTNATSPYVFSNTLAKDMFASVTWNISANNGQNIDGTVVNMAHINGQTLNNYTVVVSDGKAVFPAVLLGDYSVNISNGAAYVAQNVNRTITKDSAFSIILKEVIFTPSLLSVEPVYESDKAIFTWKIGKEKVILADDGVAEKALGLNKGFTAELGNLFDVNMSGEILSVDILATLNNNVDANGKVALYFYNSKREEIGSTARFKLEVQPDGVTFTNIPIGDVMFEGAFYTMVRYFSDETEVANSIMMDISSTPGSGWYHDNDNGWVTTNDLGYWGTFMIRCNALVTSKKSAKIVTLMQGNSAPETKVPIISTEQGIVKAQESNRGVLSYNIFFNSMTTPIAEGVTKRYYEFNETDHLTTKGMATYKAGVQAVFATGKSIVVPFSFTYDSSVGVKESDNMELSIYPNPADNIVNIENAENATISIYNLLGKKVYDNKCSSNTQQISVQLFEEGYYLVKISRDNSTETMKLMIRH